MSSQGTIFFIIAVVIIVGVTIFTVGALWQRATQRREEVSGPGGGAPNS
jgi:hypothetical protein